jgi:hypothetical protein
LDKKVQKFRKRMNKLVEENFKNIKEDIIKSIEKIKTNRTPSRKQTQTLNFLYLSVFGLLLLLIPSLFRVIFFGRISDEYASIIANNSLRLAGCYMIFFGINQKTQSYSSNLFLTTLYTFLLSILLRIYFIYSGNSIFWILDIVMLSGLAFLNFKSSNKPNPVLEKIAEFKEDKLKIN